LTAGLLFVLSKSDFRQDFMPESFQIGALRLLLEKLFPLAVAQTPIPRYADTASLLVAAPPRCYTFCSNSPLCFARSQPFGSASAQLDIEGAHRISELAQTRGANQWENREGLCK